MELFLRLIVRFGRGRMGLFRQLPDKSEALRRVSDDGVPNRGYPVQFPRIYIRHLLAHYGKPAGRQASCRTQVAS